MVCHVDHKNFWKSGSFQEETGLISSQHACRQCGDLWGPVFAGLPGIVPGHLTWGAASEQEGSQARGSGALLGHPRSLEG